MPLNAIWLIFTKKDLNRGTILCYYYIVKRKESDVINMAVINMATVVGKYHGEQNYLDAYFIMVEVDDGFIWAEVPQGLQEQIRDTVEIGDTIGVKGKLGYYNNNMVLKAQTISILGKN